MISLVAFKIILMKTIVCSNQFIIYWNFSGPYRQGWSQSCAFLLIKLFCYDFVRGNLNLFNRTYGERCFDSPLIESWILMMSIWIGADSLIWQMHSQQWKQDWVVTDFRIGVRVPWVWYSFLRFDCFYLVLSELHS